MHSFTWLFLGMLATSLVVQLWLARRQLRHVAAHRGKVPKAFRERVSLDAHQRAADYTLAKTRFGMLEAVVGAVLLLAWTLGGGLELLDRLWRSTGLESLPHGVAFLISAFLLFGLLDLPFALYRTFGIEQRFGFNRTTPRLYLVDLLKQLLLLLLIGIPLAALVLWLMQNMGELWWFYVWLVWTGFSLLMMWAYPALIAPLFNKFQPLDDAELRLRIKALLQRCGFTAKGIFVMDGSRRSAHGNAYFTGLGSNKRIVFFDTLLEHLDANEVEAVLAHELGHFRHGHIRKRLLLMTLFSLGGLALLGWLMQQSWFFTGLGVSTPSLHAALILFLMISPVFTFLFQPLLAAGMRKHEYEADAFAAAQTGPGWLIQALVKLYEENASTLTPDPLYSAFHDSHPPAPLRVARLSSTMATSA